MSPNSVRMSSTFVPCRPARTGSVHEYLGWVAVLAVAYALVGRIGLAIPYYANVVTLFWPAAGLAVACLLNWGTRYWPGVWIGSFLVSLTVLPWWAAFGVAVGSTAGTYLAATVFPALNFRGRFDNRNDVF